MSLKGVEMQVALPRTSDATHAQHHLNQKPAYDQAAAAAQQMKLAERQRTSSSEVSSSEFLNVREDGRGGSGGGGGQGRKNKSASQDAAAGSDMRHPYKGKHIDISL